MIDYTSYAKTNLLTIPILFNYSSFAAFEGVHNLIFRGAILRQ